MSKPAASETLDDVVSAYDRIAPIYSQISDSRRPYLQQVEQAIISRFPKVVRSMLDVGAGDGLRAIRIAQACHVSRLVLLEPSAGMRKTGIAGSETWAIRAEELTTVQDQFDVITCLWNVLGHIHPNRARSEVLHQISRLLSNDGRLFLDVNHRYNVSEYGVLPTIWRLLRDKTQYNERNGDVIAKWNIGGQICRTTGHVFTDREFRMLLSGSGLEVQERLVLDYSTGKQRRWPFQGNLLYVLRKPAKV